SPSSSVKLASLVDGLKTARNTWPGADGVSALNPEYETNAALTSVRSGKMRVTNRFGVTGVSMRVKTTAGPAPSAFFETKSRPGLGAAHSGRASSVERRAATMMPPVRSPPYASAVRSPGRRVADSGVDPAANGNDTPSGIQSPHVVGGGASERQA